CSSGLQPITPRPCRPIPVPTHSTRSIFFFFNDTAPTEIYTLSLHDALPIWMSASAALTSGRSPRTTAAAWQSGHQRQSLPAVRRSEEHTSELQSRSDLVCRLLLEKKKTNKRMIRIRSYVVKLLRLISVTCGT